MDRLYQMPLDQLVKSEVALATAPSSAGESPLAVVSRYIVDPRESERYLPEYVQLSLTEFPSAYRLLLAVSPAMPETRVREMDLFERRTFVRDLATLQYEKVPWLLREFNDVWRWMVNPRDPVLRSRRRNNPSPYAPEGAWEHVPRMHLYDFRAIAQRESPKPTPEPPKTRTFLDGWSNDDILQQIINHTMTPEANGLAPSVPFDVQQPTRRFRRK